jgi:hypothetical protein
VTNDAAPWPAERARAWDAERGWRVGCNFTPSSAASPLETWRAETFDPATIEREFGWAADLGFTSLRVFLHDLLWQHDREGFLARLDRFLGAAWERGLGTLLVIFDGVWDPRPHWGPQREPRPGVHNSRWVQSPGAAILADPARQDALAPYVRGLIERFRDDRRIDGWDLFNEPDNPNLAYTDHEIPDKDARSLELLRKAFAWAREAAPSQPLTAGVWRGHWDDPDALSDMDRFCLEHSDVVTFHHYGDLEALQHRVDALRRYQRPVWCTEWLARTLGSTFDPHLGWMKRAGVGAFCWGLVAGRTQTQLPWDSWVKPYDAEPEPWFHEILRPDGSPYDPAEVAYVRAVTRSDSAG